MSEKIVGSLDIGASGNPTRQRFFIVSVLFIGIFIAFLDRVNVSVLVANEQFLMEMGIKGQPVKIGMLMTSFLAAYGIAQVALSPLGDYLGPRKAMIISIALWGVAMLMGGLVATFAMMIIARILLGIGEGFYYPMQITLIKNWFPPQERGRANSIWLIGQSLGPAMAMPFFAYIIGSFGWRESFFVCFLVGLIPLYLFCFHIADTPREHKKVNSLELNHIEEGLVKERKPEVSASKETFWQRVKLFANDYRFWLVVFWYLVVNFVFWGLVSWLPSYLKAARGFSWEEMGWLASLPFIFGIVFKAITGYIIDRVGRCAPFQLAAIFFTGLCVYLAAIVPGKYFSAMLLSLSVGFIGVCTTTAWTLLQKLVPTKSISTATGTMSGISTGFSALSPVIIGICISMTGSYDGGLFCMVGMTVLASLAMSVLVIQKY
ncbi:MFS transporter [Sporomusa sp. KB1]|jgi:sugar phosphate permease|uniref:MFS transporter n=1 Tax=Sporomusa sp. KB1 TaxID=943346 RepID=UPI00119EA27C|nr:MFS transporter [Sporomusa sp. KB1]TWH46741.1 sugar phosphate permease [Sporomusa sp. KB1]